ncbi:ferredoxin [Oscillibacter sp.]|uniref:ferredoxin n=1 Tax=Oscillibacter sp. TaxID=1945593 RepID=UPI00262CA392|nr:ferredoxin [Oscillibacter sp.]MDD3347023.1 ferredoxin [Oscillibacter sp.]
MTVTIDPARCIGCGMCAFTAPAVFCMNGAHSTVLAQPDGQSFRVLDAANGCPVNAITVRK